MLCVERNIPLLGVCHNGNSSDKTLNNELLSNIGKHMAKHGLEPGASVYCRYSIDQHDHSVKPLRLEAGCFVLLTNLSGDQEFKDWPADKLLQLYKEQNGIEKNFGFLKDPMIVNSLFLKKPERIEVLGMILLIALLIWRLIERCMRQYVEKNNPEINGWEDRPTRKPTAFMMTTKILDGISR